MKTLLARRIGAVLTTASLLAAGALVAAAAPSSADSAWFVDPLTPAVRAKEIAVPNNPDAYNGPRKHTVATLRTRAGALALPLTSAVGHQLEAGQALVTTSKALFRFDSSTPTKAAKRQVRALAASLVNVRGLTCEGYADYGGPGGNEKDLSTDRARAICALVRKAAPQVGTDLASYGGNRPAVVGGDNRRSRAQNRRVVLVVTNAGAGGPVNHPPVARPDVGTVTVTYCSNVLYRTAGAADPDGTATGNVLTNDSDPDGDPLVVTTPGTYNGTYGTLVLNQDGTYTYTYSQAGRSSRTSIEAGPSDSFDYSISDGRGGTASSKLTITTSFRFFDCED